MNQESQQGSQSEADFYFPQVHEQGEEYITEDHDSGQVRCECE